MTYVDDYGVRVGRNFGYMAMSHMIADTTDELFAMADKIGLQRRWIQHRGTPREHFDVCLSKRKEAIAAGAVELTVRQLAMKMRERTHEDIGLR